MEKRLCEFCLTENDLIHGTDEMINLLYQCFSIQISNFSNKLFYVCNACNKKLEDCNEFRHQILGCLTTLKMFLDVSIPPDQFNDKIVIKNEEIELSDVENSIDFDYEDAYIGEENSNKKINHLTNGIKSNDDFNCVSKVKFENSSLDADNLSAQEKIDVNEMFGLNEIAEKSMKINNGIDMRRKYKLYGMNTEEKDMFYKCLPYISDKNILDCGKCGSNFNSHLSLILHMAIHFPNFTCDICRKPFLVKHSLINHLKTHQKKMRVSCTVCSKKITPSSLAYHMKLHSGKRMCFKCTVCKESFGSNAACLRHKELVHNLEVPKHHCMICSKQFYTQSRLTVHVNAVHEGNVSKKYRKKVGNRRFKFYGMSAEEKDKFHNCYPYIFDKNNTDCGVCGSRFNSHLKLMHHMAIHFPNYICDHCKKSFLLKHSLVQHMKQHNDKTRVLCIDKDPPSQIIPQTGEAHSLHEQNQKFNFSTHENPVQKIAKYKFDCDYCTKSFCQKHTLDNHIRAHHNTPLAKTVKRESSSNLSLVELSHKKRYANCIPFELDMNEQTCKVCGESFSSHKSLVSHLAVHYGNIICDICGKQFLLKDHLLKHRIIHNEKVQCPLCNKELQPRCLNVHMKVMHKGKKITYPCSQCGINFESFHQRLKHLEEDHNVVLHKIQCDRCPMKFLFKNQLKRHILRMHLKERNYSCDVCGSKYFAMSDLRKHSMLHDGGKFICDLCSKTYSQKRSLAKHMLSKHSNIPKVPKNKKSV